MLAISLVGGHAHAPSATAIGVPEDPTTLAAIIESGSIDGAPYVVAVPRRNWNGTVVVYAGGTRDRKDDDREMEDRSPPTGPSGAHFVGFVAGEPVLTPGTDAYSLVASGYGWASTARKRNGYAVREGLNDLKNLVAHFHQFATRADVRSAGEFERTIGFACSQGTIEAYKMAEDDDPYGFDGIVTVGGVGSGSPRATDLLLAYQLAWDVVFGWPATWGDVGDVRNAGDDPAHPEDLDEDEIHPVIDAHATSAMGLARLEFIRLVLGGPPGAPEPAAEWHSAFSKSMAHFATEFAADLEATAGGPPYQNLDHHYKLTDVERLYLRRLSPEFDVDGALGAMNRRTTYAPITGPREFVETYASFSGRLQHPVLTLKGKNDWVAPWHDHLYANTVAEAGKSDLLRQLYVHGSAQHCAGFTVQQIQTAIRAVDDWIETGAAPDRRDPTLLAAGFDPFYVPPQWPFE